MKCYFNVVSSIYTAAQFWYLKNASVLFFLKKRYIFQFWIIFCLQKQLFVHILLSMKYLIKMWTSWFRKYSVKKNSVHTFYCEWHLWDWFAPSQSNATIRLEFQHSGMWNVYGAFISFDCISHAKRLWLP